MSALQRDSGYALARAGLAMASADMYLRFARAGEVERWGERAEAEARAALAADPDLPEAHLARAAVARKREFDWSATVTSSRRALGTIIPTWSRRGSSSPPRTTIMAIWTKRASNSRRGRPCTAPMSSSRFASSALIALFSGSFAPARVRLEEVSRVSSQAIGDTYLALAYFYSGSIDRGETMLQSLAHSPSASTSSRASAALAGVLASQRHPAEAREQIERVLKAEYRDHHVAYSLGAAFAQLGDTDQADRWLRTAVDTGFPCLPFFERDPLLDPLRHRSEFAALLEYVQSRRRSSLSLSSR